MNEFTKDELIYIKRYIFDGAASISAGGYKILEKKIECLIDEYERDQKTKDALNYIVKKVREWDLKL